MDIIILDLNTYLELLLISKNIIFLSVSFQPKVFLALKLLSSSLARAELIFSARVCPSLFSEAKEKFNFSYFSVSLGRYSGPIYEPNPIFFSNYNSCLKNEGFGLI